MFHTREEEAERIDIFLLK